MSDFHGIIFAYGAVPELGELVRRRTASSLPFCGRYRLIDFALSSLMNAGIHDVGVIMRRDYQSLLDHLASGKDWDMGRRIGGLRMLPPFGLPEYHRGDYTGTIEALNAVSTYIHDINAKYIIMMHGNTAANIDLRAAIRQHLASGAEITAICTDATPDYRHHRYIVDADGFARSMIFNQTAAGEGAASLEAYIISKPLLISMMDACAAANHYHFHRDAIADYLASGGKVNVFFHRGYGKRIMSTEAYFNTNMDMLSAANRAELFPAERPVRTKTHEDVSTYYAEGSMAKMPCCRRLHNRGRDRQLHHLLRCAHKKGRAAFRLRHHARNGDRRGRYNEKRHCRQIVCGFVVPDDNGQREAAGSAPEGHKDLIRSYL